MSTFTFTYNRTHTSIFVADNMRNVLRDIIKWSGLDQTQLVDDWGVLGNAVRIWLGEGDLLEITIEFYRPGNGALVSRWDFPINYDGSGVDDDMWVTKNHIRRTMEKAPPVPSNARYRVILSCGLGGRTCRACRQRHTGPPTGWSAATRASPWRRPTLWHRSSIGGRHDLGCKRL